MFLRRPLTYAAVTLTAWGLLFVIGVLAQAVDLPDGITPTLTDPGFLFFVLSEGIIVHIAIEDIRSHSVRIHEAVWRGVVRFVPLLLMTIIVVIGFFVGWVLLIVPSMMLMSAWCVGGPVCVFERLGPWKSLNRSRYLTRGFRWKLFALLLLSGLSSLAFSLLCRTGLFYVMQLDVEYAEPLFIIMSGGQSIVLASFGAIGSAVAYHDLRAVKEGVDVESIASVFD
jgi:hypothetical protein